MPTPLGDIFVRIGIETKDFEAGLDRVQKMSAKVFAGVSAAIAGVSVIGAGFEKEITKVGALTGATGETFEQLGKTARDVAKETEFTAKQAAEGMGFFAMAGFSAEEAMAALRPTTILASTGFLDLGRAADIVTNVMSGMGIGFDELNHSIDVLVATATSANTTVDMLGEAFSYAGPVMKSFGISFEEGAAAMGILGDAGIQASRAGTNLRMAIVKLAKPTGEAAAVMERLGVTALDANGKMFPLSTIFGKIAKSGATAQDMLKMFGPRAAAAALILTESMKSSEKSLESFTEELRNSGGKSEEIFKRMSETVSFQFNVMKSNFEEAALVLWDEFKPAVMGVVKVGQRMAQVFAQLDPKILSIGASLATLTAGLAGATAAIITIGKVAAVVFAPMTLTIMGVVAAVAVLVVGLGMAINRMGDLNKLSDKLSAYAQALSRSFTAFSVFGGGETKGVGAGAGSGAGTGDGVASQFAAGLKGVLDEAGQGFSKVLDAMGVDTKNTAAEVKTLGKALNKTTEEVKKTAEAAATAGGAMIEFDWSAAAEGQKAAAANAIRNQEIIDGYNNSYKSLLDGHLADQATYQQKIRDMQTVDQQVRADAISNQVTWANAVKHLGDGMWTIAQSTFSKLGTLGNFITAAMQGMAAGGPIGAIIAVIVELLMSLESIKKTIDIVGEGFQMLFENISPIFDSLASTSEMANEGLSKVLKAAQPLFKFFGEIMGLLSKVFGVFINAFNNVLEGIFDILGPFLEIFSSIIGVVGEMFQGFSDVAGILSPIHWAFEGLSAIAKELQKAFQGMIDWFDQAGKDVGKAFDDMGAWIENGFKGSVNDASERFGKVYDDIRNSINEQLEALNETARAQMEYMERMKSLYDIAGVTAVIEKAKKNAELMSISYDEIAGMADKLSKHGDDALKAGMAELFKALIDAGESIDQAAFRLHAGADPSMIKEIWEEYEASLEGAGDNVSDFGDKIEEATEALTNVPTGYKLVQTRLASIADDMESITPETMTSAASGAMIPDGMAGAMTDRIININIEEMNALDAEDFVAQVGEAMERTNLLEGGTTVLTTAAPGAI
jgi:TP901 family phage tail tape measure protein